MANSFFGYFARVLLPLASPEISGYSPRMPRYKERSSLRDLFKSTPAKGQVRLHRYGIERDSPITIEMHRPSNLAPGLASALKRLTISDDSMLRDVLKSRDSDSFSFAFVAKISGAVVGWSAATYFEEDGNFLLSTFVDAAYRRRGVAKNLLSKEKEFCRSFDPKAPIIAVAAVNEQGSEALPSTGANALFESLGFKPEGEDGRGRKRWRTWVLK